MKSFMKKMLLIGVVLSALTLAFGCAPVEDIEDPADPPLEEQPLN